MLPTDPVFEPDTRQIETERLLIRVDTEADYVRMFRNSDDDTLKAMFGICTDEALQQQKDKVIGGLSNYRTTVVFFHFFERTLGRVIGNFAFHNWYPMHSRAEVGYIINDLSLRNRGYLREATRPIIEFGFAQMRLNRIEAFIHPENIASQKVVEHVGFKREGLHPQRYCYEGILSDAFSYGLLRS